MINNASFQSTSTLAFPNTRLVKIYYSYLSGNNVSLYFRSVFAESAVGEADD